MAAAFACHAIEEVPILLQPRAEQFVRLFDTDLLPRPGDLGMSAHPRGRES
jgi:hypothetical protein